MKSLQTRNTFKIINHFIFCKQAARNIKQQVQLAKVLSDFRKDGLITYRSYVIHLFSYVAKSLSVDAKARILQTHYSLLKKKFCAEKLKDIFGEGIDCFCEAGNGDVYKVTLSSSFLLEFEGSLSLFLKVNDIKVFTLSFTFAPGYVFNIDEPAIIFISCVQRNSNELLNSKKATRHFADIMPGVILMKVLEAIAEALQINTVIGVSAANQLSLSSDEEYLKFHSIYDDFWLSYAARPVQGNYLIRFPLPQKCILQVPQKHRNRVLKKRKRLEQLHAAAFDKIKGIILPG